MRLAVTAALLLAASPALAGWQYWGNPNRRFEMAAQARTAAVERVDAVDAILATNASWAARVALAFERGKLVQVKASVNSCWGYYIRPACFNGGDNLNAYLATGTVEAAFWTNRVEFLRASGAPTNWFDSTPWIGLDAHSNGWKYVPAVFSNLVSTASGDRYAPRGSEPLRYTARDVTNYGGYAVGYRGASNSAVAWVNAASGAGADFREVQSSLASLSAYAHWWGTKAASGPTWTAWIERKNVWLDIPSNRVACVRQLYHRAAPTDWLIGFAINSTNVVFDNQADNVSTALVMRVEWGLSTAATNALIGNMVQSEPPAALNDEPIIEEEYYGKGWRIKVGVDGGGESYNPFVVWRFDVAGGFQF